MNFRQRGTLLQEYQELLADGNTPQQAITKSRSPRTLITKLSKKCKGSNPPSAAQVRRASTKRKNRAEYKSMVRSGR